VGYVSLAALATPWPVPVVGALLAALVALTTISALRGQAPG
jgi:hypothetical protein